MHTYTLTVSGMTCDHCVRAVTEELSALEPGAEVTIDLVPTGDSTVTLAADAALSGDVLRAAVSEAGYELVGEPASS